MWDRLGLAIALVLAGMLALACATAAPDPWLVRAERAVAAAEGAAARRYAPSDLSRARDNLEGAQAAALDKANWIEARRMAEKAEADAAVAVEKSRVQQLRISASELRRSVDEAGAR